MVSIHRKHRGADTVRLQFWLTYVDYIQEYHTFDRTVQTNNIDLFVDTFSRIVGLFFITNHVNYTCWMTRYCMLKICGIWKTPTPVFRLSPRKALSP